MFKVWAAAVMLFICAATVRGSDCPPKLYNYDKAAPALNMFYIEKNNNANVVFYDLNLTKDGLIDSKKPLNVYWRIYAEDGRKEDLTFIERKLAFGVNSVKTIDPGHKYSARIASLQNDIIISYYDGCGMVTSTENGTVFRLEKIFLELTGPVYFASLVYMDIYGQALRTGKPFYYRFTPE